ncbi:MAG: hypothetical protein RL235_1191 [Chlamydiota bacterium]|jgi:hypothetical protein
MDTNKPWLTIWTRPRETIRHIIHHNPNQSLWWLATIYGFSSLLNSFQAAALGSLDGGVGLLLFLAVLFAPLWGYLVFSVWSWVVLWTGRMFKGQGEYAAVRAAYAWSCVPLLINGILWLILISLFGVALFLDTAEEVHFSDGWLVVLFVTLLGKVAMVIWSLVIYLNALAEVQRFSMLRAIGNVIVAGIACGVVLGVLGSLITRGLYYTF